MLSLKIKSFAKINIYLKILSKRSDGFHNIETLMQNISLYDDLIFESIDGEKIEIVCDDLDLPTNEKNICYKAASIIRNFKKIRKGVKITIKKNIPFGAGLGGGSSNGAATIFALNKIWNLSLSFDEMMLLASCLGCDVPFFIVGGKAICRGRGELVERLTISGEDKFFLILVKPDDEVNTKWAYEEWDKETSLNPNFFEIQLEINNDFEKVILKKYPNIENAKKMLIDSGLVGVSLTGSGSAVYGKVVNEEYGKKIVEKIRSFYPKTFLLHTVDKSFEMS